MPFPTMQLTRDDGVLALTAVNYRLVFAKDRPYVYLNDAHGNQLADLFVLSSIHTMHGRDDATAIGSWQVQESQPEITFTLQAQSSTWKNKTYRFRCRDQRFEYEMDVEGTGDLAEVHYLGGYYSGQRRWGSGFFWSGQYFTRLFNPEPNKEEINYLAPSSGAVIDMTGVPLPIRGSWFFTPPPFCYAVQAERGWLSIGVQARPGANRFSEYHYHGQVDGFYLTLNYDGHTHVDGVYHLPALGFDFGEDEFSVLEAHVNALESAGYVQLSHSAEKPDWWSEPIFCGWGQECYLFELARTGAPMDFCRQEFYEQWLAALEQQDLSPGIITIDDKWQVTYGDNCVDENKWPDLRGFAQQQHARGRHVLLWLQAWGAEGLPPEECVRNPIGAVLACDPTNTRYEQRLRESVRRMLSPDGYDADGFKIDFTGRMPSGPGLHTQGDVWGLELMKQYLGIIYEEAKKSKPDALIITHTPNPYLADVVDMIRLNDLNPRKDVIQAMYLRARVASIACPDALIDTDNWQTRDKAQWREYTRRQPEYGVPSLYYATHIDASREPLDADDYALIRAVWAQARENFRRARAANMPR